MPHHRASHSTRLSLGKHATPVEDEACGREHEALLTRASHGSVCTTLFDKYIYILKPLQSREIKNFPKAEVKDQSC